MGTHPYYWMDRFYIGSSVTHDGRIIEELLGQGALTTGVH
jgi:hypothetical protein